MSLTPVDPRQIATIDRILGGRLTVNIISSDMPGETLASAPRYARTVEAMHILKTLLNGSGGTIGQPITPAAQDTLQYIAGLLDSEATRFTTEEGRAGQIQKRFEGELTNLQTRSDLLTKEIGDEADADIGEVSMKLSTLLAQYQAAAKTFSELSKLSLLDYL